MLCCFIWYCNLSEFFYVFLLFYIWYKVLRLFCIHLDTTMTKTKIYSICIRQRYRITWIFYMIYRLSILLSIKMFWGIHFRNTFQEYERRYDCVQCFLFACWSIMNSNQILLWRQCNTWVFHIYCYSICGYINISFLKGSFRKMNITLVW